MLDRIVERDKNHVSLFAVGLGFGYNVNDLHAVDFIKDLSDRVKKYNDEILTYFTSEFTGYDEYYKITDFNIIDLSNPCCFNLSREELKKISEKDLRNPVIIKNKLIRVYPGNLRSDRETVLGFSHVDQWENPGTRFPIYPSGKAFKQLIHFPSHSVKFIV